MHLSRTSRIIARKVCLLLSLATLFLTQAQVGLGQQAPPVDVDGPYRQVDPHAYCGDPEPFSHIWYIYYHTPDCHSSAVDSYVLCYEEAACEDILEPYYFLFIYIWVDAFGTSQCGPVENHASTWALFDELNSLYENVLLPWGVTLNYGFGTKHCDGSTTEEHVVEIEC